MLMDVEDNLPYCQMSMSPKQARRFSETRHDCVAVLQELEGKLAKFGIMGTSGDEFHVRLRIAWKKLQWNQTEIKEFRERIESTIKRFHSFLEMVN
jgi:hypothetical protein